MSDTPETDAFIGEGNDGSFMTEGEIAMCEFTRKLERERNLARERGFESADVIERLEGQLRKARDERDIARIPICIGKPLIQILAKDGQWTSENGNGVVAADCLFKQDPYAEIEAMRVAIKEVHDALKDIDDLHNHDFPTDSGGDFSDTAIGAFNRLNATLAKLKTFLPTK